MPTQNELIIEQAKQLALTISLLNNRYDKSLGEFNKKLSEVYAQLNEKQAKTDEDLKFISEQVVFASSFDETKNKLDYYIKTIEENFNNYSLNHEHPYSLDSHTHDQQYAFADHRHDYVSTDVYDAQISDFNSQFNSYINNNEEFLKYLSRIIEDNYTTVLESIVTSNENLDQISSRLAKGIDDVEYKVDTLKSSIKKDINDVTDIIDSVKTNIEKVLLKSFKDVDNKIEKFVDDIVNDISVLNDKIQNYTEIQTKTNTYTSKRIDKLDKSLKEFDVSNQTEFTKIEVKLNQLSDGHKDLELEVDELQSNQESLKDGLDSAFELIKNKPEYSEILLKTDLDKLKQDIIDNIPIPKDGKDAEEWEFRPHPSRKGILVFKKKSQKNWNYIDLNHIVPKPQEYDQQQYTGFIGGGGGGGGSSVSILWNNVLVSTNSNLNFIGTGITSVTSVNNVTTVRIDAGTSSGGGGGGNFLRYIKNLNGNLNSIPLAEHGINNIVNFYIKDSNNKIIEVEDSIVNGNITLNSNINLVGCILYIFGFTSIASYVKQLSGFSVTVPSTEHNINEIIKFEVRNSNGRSLEVQETLNTLNNTITINSNVDLTNCTLTIKGI